MIGMGVALLIQRVRNHDAQTGDLRVGGLSSYCSLSTHNARASLWGKSGPCNQDED